MASVVYSCCLQLVSTVVYMSSSHTLLSFDPGPTRGEQRKNGRPAWPDISIPRLMSGRTMDTVCLLILRTTSGLTREKQILHTDCFFRRIIFLSGSHHCTECTEVRQTMQNEGIQETFDRIQANLHLCQYFGWTISDENSGV